MALLGIASGAFKIGQKIFQGIRNRKERKVEKRAQSLIDAQEKQAQVQGKIGSVLSTMGGNDTQVISGAGNFLAGIKNAFTPNADIANFTPISGAQAVAKQNASGNGGGINPMYLLIGGAVLLLLMFKKR